MVLGYSLLEKQLMEVHPKLKVLFFTETLAEGGITRVLLTLLKGIDRDQFTPSIAVFHTKGMRMGELPGDVQLSSLDSQKRGNGTEFFKLIGTYRKILKDIDPHVVISSVWKPHMISLLAHRMDFSRKRKLILREDNALSPYFRDVHGKGAKGRVSPLLTRFLYPRADHIIAVSEGLKNESIGFGIPGEKITVIYNPLDLKAINEQKRKEIDIRKPYVLFVGRLCKQKNISLLIQAYALIKDKRDVALLIIGRGEEEPRLRNLVDTLGIEDRVFFKGYVSNPFPYMHHARVLVLSSDYEGLSCVLVEAMACGAPVVSTNCPHGPSEIIRQGANGFLVPTGNPTQLAEAMDRILGHESLRRSFIEEGYKDVQSYHMDAIVRRYETVIRDVYSG